MPQFMMALDQGTTSTRCMIIDRTGAVISSDQREHHQIYPQPGWVEHDALEIWQKTQQVIQAALAKAGLSAKEIAGIGITNQRETVVVWNRTTGEPVAPAIVWQDTRTASLIEQLSSQGGQDRFREKTGLPLATYFSGPKIGWMLEHTPGLLDSARSGGILFGNIDSWLIWNLTGGVNGGVHVTDVTNASRTMLMDLHTLQWDQEMLAIFGIPIEMLPVIRPSSQFYGSAVGILEGVPIAGDLGDQQAALFGQACFSVGDAKNTYGTGCFMLLNTGKNLVASQHGLLTTVGYQVGDSSPAYCLEGSIAITGALVQWLRDNLKIIRSSAEVETLARSVDDTGGIYFVPAFSGLFAPYWRSDARGIIAGMTRYSNAGHIARAALEATAYQTREVLEAMEQDSGVKLMQLKVDGGMVYNELLMQFQADQLSVPVVRPKVAETTALGAAYAAGLAVGFWQSQAELCANWGEARRWIPTMDKPKRAALYAGWKKAVSRSFNWVSENA